jgi:putative ABC transport system permease protein
VQVAMALVLLVSSGLMIRTVRAIRAIQPGFSDAASIQTMRVSVPSAQVHQAEQVARTQQAIAEKLAVLPGVQAVTFGASVPMDGNQNSDPVYAEDKTYAVGQLPALRRYRYVAPGYFSTLGVPFVVGRDITWTDIFEKRPVVVVSENLAREMWGSVANAMGKRVRERPGGTWREVVGVVRDVRDDGVTAKAPTSAYWPYYTAGFWGEQMEIRRDVAFVIRSARAGSASLFREAQHAVWSVNPNLTTANVATMQELYDKSNARTSFTLVMLTIAAGMALLLGVIGIYGVISYSISQRTREIGVRMALGASQFTVRRMFVGHAMVLTGIGVALGLAGAFALARLMASLLFGVSPLDPVTYGSVAAILAIAALLAAYFPARRATLIEPVTALRAE